MQYNLFLIPDTSYFYPKSVINLLNNLGNYCVAITLDKEYLSNKSPNTLIFERIQPDGSIMDNIFLIDNIRKVKPHVVLLDNCFWDHTELNSFLLDGLFLLQHEVPFLLINVVPLAVYKQNGSQSIVQREKAKSIYFPKCRIGQASWADTWSSAVQFYENRELDNDMGQYLIPKVEPELYKTVYKLFHGIQSLKLRNDFDLFTLFLDKLRIKHSDEHLLRFVLTVHKYFFDIADEKLLKKDVVFSSIEMNNLFERLNRPTLFLIMNNQLLFDEIVSFFK